MSDLKGHQQSTFGGAYSIEHELGGGGMSAHSDTTSPSRIVVVTACLHELRRRMAQAARP